MRFGVGVRFQAPNSIALVGRAIARSRVGALAGGKVALAGSATARFASKPGLGSVPVITSTSFSIGTSPAFNTLIGTIVATNSPTSFAITSGNPSGFFSVNNSGNLRVGTSAVPPDNSYSLTVTASNSFGTSPAKIIAVTVGAIPVVATQSLNLVLPATNGEDVGIVSTSNGTPTSFAITSGNSSGFFAIDSSGDITVTSTGAAGITAQTYSLTVQATNALGSGSGVVSITASAVSGFSDSDLPTAANRPTYNAGTNTLTWIGPNGGGANNGNPVQQSRVLTNRTTSIATTANGQVIEGLNISDRINVRHSNVIIRQCRLTNPDYYNVYCDSGSPANVVIEDCLMDGGNRITTTGVSPEAATGLILRRCNISGYENGAFVSNGMQIRDCWIHDLANSGEAHTDGIQGGGGFTSVIIDHNNIDSLDTSCIIMQNESAAFSGLVVTNNKLTGNVASCIYIRGDKSTGVVGACTVTGNRMHTSNSAGYYFSVASVAGPITWSDNVDDITGAPIAGP
jgi:hypothetical protein